MSERARLEAELGQIHALMAEIPEDQFLERMGLESRAAEVEELLQSIAAQESIRRARVTLLFGGYPVSGTTGIDARFATDVLRRYQDLVSKTYATHLPRGLQSYGPVPAEQSTHLHITGVARGSFGFHLEEMSPPTLLPAEGSALADAVDHTNKVIAAACESDEAFADAMEEVGTRVFAALKEFFDVIYSNRATFKMQSTSLSASFDADRLRLALERAGSEQSEQQDHPVFGIFKNILLGSGRFEHLLPDGTLISGRKDPSRRPEEYLGWENKPCIAHMRVLTIRRPGRELKRYTLLRIEAANEEPQP